MSNLFCEFSSPRKSAKLFSPNVSPTTRQPNILDVTSGCLNVSRGPAPSSIRCALAGRFPWVGSDDHFSDDINLRALGSLLVQDGEAQSCGGVSLNGSRRESLLLGLSHQHYAWTSWRGGKSADGPRPSKDPPFLRKGSHVRSVNPTWRGLFPLAQSSAYHISRKIRCGSDHLFWATRGELSFPCSPLEVVSTFLGFYVDFLLDNQLWTRRTSHRVLELRRMARELRNQRQADTEALCLRYQGGEDFTGSVLSTEYHLYLTHRPPLLLPSRPKARRIGGRRRSDPPRGKWRAPTCLRSDSVRPCPGPVGCRARELSLLSTKCPWYDFSACGQSPQVTRVRLGRLVVLHHWLHPRAGVG